MIKGVKLDIYDAREGEPAAARPARSCRSTPNGMTIAANGGAILAKRVKAPDGKKIAAAEWAASAGVKAGDTFDPPAPKA